MLELGDEEISGHRSVIKKFSEIENGIMLAVGERMCLAAQELVKKNINPERIYQFGDPMSAGRKLQEIIQQGDLILIKGSQGMRMEKIVEEVMAEPQKAEQLLCRQNKVWRETLWKQV